MSRHIDALPENAAEIRSRNGEITVYTIEDVTKVTITGDYTSISYTDANGKQRRVTTNLPFVYNE